MNDNLTNQGDIITGVVENIIIFIVIAMVIGIIIFTLKKELINAILSAVLGVGVSIMMSHHTITMGEGWYMVGECWLPLMAGICVAVWSFFRLLPTIFVEEATRTYVILGTVFSRDETVSNIGTVIVTSLILGGVTFGLGYLAYCYKWLFVFHIVGPILALLGVLAAIRYFRYRDVYYDDYDEE